MNRNAVIDSLVESHRPSGSKAAKRYKQYVAFVNERQGIDSRSPAAHSEESHDDHIEALTTLHRDAAEPWDWHQIATSPPPPPRRENEASAQGALDSYKPTFFERLLGQAEGHRQALAVAVSEARTSDEAAWQQACEQWNWCQMLARNVLRRDIRAYITAVATLGPFEEMLHLGVQVETRIADPSLVEAFAKFRYDAVPWNEYKLLASGRTSVKEMPKVKHRELTQEHVCSAAIRIARDMFSLLPVARTFVHVSTVLLDPATGHSDTHTLLSVEFDRERLVGSNFGRVNPVSAVESFRHAMNFKKTAGLLPVDPLEPLAQLTSL
jgi:hypothetical protein